MLTLSSLCRRPARLLQPGTAGPRSARPAHRSGRRRLLLAAAAGAALLLAPGVALAGGSGSVVTTSTGVVTHGSIRTTSDTVGWLLRCDYSHSAPDDPIARAGMPGMSHLHDFYGNAGTNAGSTVTSMQADGTSCGTAADTAAYWSPSLYVHGQVVPPTQTSQQVYYRSKYPKGTVVEPLPPDLRVVVGDAMATSVTGNPALVGGADATGGIYWECTGNTSRHYSLPPSCSGGQVLLNVQFPSCWNGRARSGANDDADLAYTPSGSSCPSGFPHALPRISLKVKYAVGRDGSAVTLSSGPAASVHADFWNTWQPAGLRYLVARCLNAGVSCGTNPVAPMGS